jgi:hypothetical protein
VRALADRERIERLMEAFGRLARRDLRVYLVGGATAVLHGWRPTTIDVDLVMRPEDDTLLRAIPSLKEELQVNVELASPLDFIPVPPGWEDRGTFIRQTGPRRLFALRSLRAGAGESRARSSAGPGRSVWVVVRSQPPLARRALIRRVEAVGSLVQRLGEELR